MLRDSVIATPGSTPASLAAKAATTTIPIVFLVGGDPVAMGLVASLNRPGGNATGVNLQTVELVGKRLGMLRELAPGANRFVALVNPNNAYAEAEVKDLQAGASALGLPVEILRASTGREIDATFTNLMQKPGGALLVCSGDACNWDVQQWPPDIVGECLQVLHDGGKVEFVASAGKTPQPHTLETVVRLQVRKTHLDLLALVAGFGELGCTHQGARCIPCVLMHVARDLSKGHIRSALGLGRTWTAVAGARAINDGPIIVHRPGRPEKLTLRADVETMPYCLLMRSQRTLSLWAVAHLER